MELAGAVFIIMAGLAYVMWKYHQEFNGGITSALILVLFVCGPLALWQWVMNDLCLEIGIIGLIGHIVFMCYMFFGSKPQERAAKELAKSIMESNAIWDEVNALPIPDAETLRKYKLANKIPLIPENYEPYNNAAIQCWRTNEYNKRFKEKHSFVYYQRM